MTDEDNRNAGEVPENLQGLIEHIGIVPPISEVSSEEQAEINRLIELGQNGRCMCCESPLGQNTVLLVKSSGIHAVYCGGQCMNDHSLVGWLEETYEDVVTGIKFRGGAGDTVEGEEEDDGNNNEEA